MGCLSVHGSDQNRVLVPRECIGEYPAGGDKRATAWTSLDYADQRFYANQWGRFMSPDPSIALIRSGRGAVEPSHKALHFGCNGGGRRSFKVHRRIIIGA